MGFDQSGFRSSFSLDVMTISTDGLQKVSSKSKWTIKCTHSWKTNNSKWNTPSVTRCLAISSKTEENSQGKNGKFSNFERIKLFQVIKEKWRDLRILRKCERNWQEAPGHAECNKDDACGNKSFGKREENRK